MHLRNLSEMQMGKKLTEAKKKTTEALIEIEHYCITPYFLLLNEKLFSTNNNYIY
jgi:hypothetical protein